GRGCREKRAWQVSTAAEPGGHPPHGAEKRCTKLNPDSSTDWQNRFDSDYPCGHGTPEKPSGPITFGVGKPLITPIVPISSSSKTIVGTAQAKSDSSHRPTWLRLMMVLI